MVIHFHSVNTSRSADVPSLPKPLNPSPPNGTWGSSWMVG
jgi:hypothetical protein